MFTSDTLSGQTILVTGGGSGLGLEMARTFSRLGASVVICGRDYSRLTQAVHSSPEGSKPIEAIACDVRDHAAVQSLFSTLRDRGLSITSLVNNAAGNFLSLSEDLSPNAFKTVVDIVLHGSFNCTQVFGQHRIKDKQPGTVLNVVTTYTECGSAFVLPSACAKAGVYAMTTSLAAEWAEYGIRLNAIAPGPFPTPGAWERLVPDKTMEDLFQSRVPLGRFGEAHEVADLATFLLSPLSAFVTGECITIDGGERLNAGQFNFLLNTGPREQLRSTFSRMREHAKGSSKA